MLLQAVNNTTHHYTIHFNSYPAMHTS